MGKAGLLARLAVLMFAGAIGSTRLQAAAPDPFAWLEDIDSERSLAWVKAHNDASVRVLEAMPRFDEYRLRAEAALTQKNRIAFPRLVEDDRASDNAGIFGDKVVNFWQDEEHVRGLWREAPLAGYLAGRPQWRTLIDLDALALAEKRNWTWKGATCLAPERLRCLVKLSDGGKDATVLREFDRATGGFVADGFTTSESKNIVAWLDKDSVLLGANFGPESMTDSGYPRQIRLWRRGVGLAASPVLFTAEKTDVSADVDTSLDESGRMLVSIYQARTAFTGVLLHLGGDNKLVKGPLPEDADILATYKGSVIALMRRNWRYEGRSFAAGSLVAYAVRPLLSGGKPVIEQIYSPPAGAAVQKVMAGDQALYISVLSNVSGRVLEARRGTRGWSKRLLSLPANSTLVPIAATGNTVLVKVDSFLEPTRLMAAGGRPTKTIAALPPRFDASRFTVTQLFAKASDGVRIPYFVVRPKGLSVPGPTLLFAYGGFEVSSLPSYVSPDIQFWLEEGGTYVLANIRGGGEYGPAWHQAGLRDKRQRVFDDLYTVAEALVKTGLTTPPQLGLHGRSNGGLLASVALTQRPRLFGAIMIGVPLVDMERYHKLLAGASWMDEYGNPDVPSDLAFISAYSPYQNIRPGQPYPVPFIYTSTKDDRVHPGHARKLAAKLESLGYPYFYYENTQGGHAGVASLKESAYRIALMVTYLNRELRGIGKDSMAPPTYGAAP